MVFTNVGKSGLALLMARSGALPAFCAIGSGSGAESATIGSLFAEVLSTPRKTYTGSPDTTTAQQVTWTFDFSSVTMSGINLQEFGIAVGSVVGSQDLWNREGIIPIQFDGNQELTIDITFKVV